MTIVLGPPDEKTATLIAIRRASINKIGEWGAPFAIQMILYCIERADGDSLAYWLDCIKNGDEDCSIGNHAFDWLLDAAAALLAQSALDTDFLLESRAD